MPPPVAISEEKDKLFQARIQKVLASTNIFEVLVDLGFISPDSSFEHNIPCPFHSLGREARPSGRVYKDSTASPSGVFYCFTCGSTWDPIKFVRDFKGVSYGGAVEYLETFYHIVPPTVQEILEGSYDYTPREQQWNFKEFDPTAVAEKVREKKVALTKEQMVAKLEYAEAKIRMCRGHVDLAKFLVMCKLADVLWAELAKETPIEGLSDKISQFLGSLRSSLQ